MMGAESEEVALSVLDHLWHGEPRGRAADAQTPLARRAARRVFVAVKQT